MGFVLVLFDDDCGLCTRSVRWLSSRIPDLTARPLEVPSPGVVVVLEDGSRLLGAPALAALLHRCGGGWGVLGRFLQIPGPSLLARLVYRVIAANRARISRFAGWEACQVPSRDATPSDRTTPPASDRGGPDPGI